MPRATSTELDQIIAKYALEPQSVEIEGRHYEILAVRDQDALLAASDDLEHPPYGLLLWESAVAVAKVLARRGRPGLEGRTVLELGCGIGLPGIVAASYGARVVLTDHLSEAIAIARVNAMKNDVTGMHARPTDWLDWNFANRFDIVIGADIAYETEMHDVLLEVLTTSVASGGEILLADPSREQGTAFVRRMTALGWGGTTETFIEPDAAGRPNMPAATVTVHSLRR